MRKFFITTIIIFIILFNNFNTSYAIPLNPIYNHSIISSYNLELLEMFPKTIKSMNTTGSISQRLFKFIENLFLLLESSNTKHVLNLQPILIYTNYKYNSQFDIKNQIINNQDSTSKLSLSGTPMCDNGCEVIAVNNALKLMGYKTSIADIVQTFQKNNIVICDFLINGFFGSNPYSIGKALKNYQINYDIISLDELNEEGVYIVSYWNSINYDSMLHTIAIQTDGNGNYIPYNLSNEPRIPLKTLISRIDSYIIGYKLYE